MARKKEFDPSERLVKARNLFWEKGYHATSMQDLVDRMRLNRGSIYNTFGNKHTIFLDSLKNYSAQVLKEYKQAASGKTSPLEAIKAIVNGAVQRTFRENKACMAVKSSFEMAPVDKEVADLLRSQNHDLVSMLEQLLKEAQKAGEVNEDNNPTETARFIVSNFSGLWQMYVLFENKKMVNNLAKFLLQKIV